MDKKPRKLDQVLIGARKVFMASGYEGANVDVIAAEAGVSKATIYNYFPDKKSLFTAVAAREIDAIADRAAEVLDNSRPPREILYGIGQRLLDFHLSEFGENLYRIVIGEADRFPNLAKSFYETGPAVAHGKLVRYFGIATDRGELTVPEAARSTAAFQYIELCRAGILWRSLFNVKTEYSDEEQAEVLDAAVDMFLARYGAKGA